MWNAQITDLWLTDEPAEYGPYPTEEAASTAAATITAAGAGPEYSVRITPAPDEAAVLRGWFTARRAIAEGGGSGEQARSLDRLAVLVLRQR